MAVEKMKLINIIGPIAEFDRIVMDYVIENDIHLEDMLHVLANAQDVFPFTEANPYVQLVSKVNETLSIAGIDSEALPKGNHSMTPQEIEDYSEQIKTMLVGIMKKREEIEDSLEKNKRIIAQVEHISNIDIPLKEIFEFEHIKVRFGKMPKESYKKLNEFLSEYYAAFFFKFEEKQDEVYGLYCAPESIREKIDNLFSTLYFERMHIANKASGLPSEVIQSLTRENAELKEKLAELKKDMDIIVSREFDKLCTAARSIYYLYEAFNVRKYAAHTEESFYIAGWVPESEADALAREFDAEPNVTFLLEEPDMAKHVKPPTKLKNNRFVRPFESFVRMYSLPSYNEIDPTFLFALTYSVMFGIMYGDVGHGIVLALVGYLLQRRGVFLGPILKVCGFVAALFGVFYGSAFGVEFEYSFMYKPMASGNIMKTLIAAVALGSVIIGVSMFLNMANGIKQKDAGRVLFDSNGLAGFIFYWATVIGVLSLVLGYGIITKWYVALFIVLPLALVFFKRPLSALIAKRADWAPKNKGEFILENFFELFELVLSYITNTISFIRVGAFALIHAGMMMVVFSLANVQQHSIEELNFAKVLVLIFGNVLVMGLEGLLVAIQVLRLEFYEMFSRYFSGGGNPFTPSKVSAFSKTTTR